MNEIEAGDRVQVLDIAGTFPDPPEARSGRVVKGLHGEVIRRVGEFDVEVRFDDGTTEVVARSVIEREQPQRPGHGLGTLGSAGR